TCHNHVLPRWRLPITIRILLKSLTYQGQWEFPGHGMTDTRTSYLPEPNVTLPVWKNVYLSFILILNYSLTDPINTPCTKNRWINGYTMINGKVETIMTAYLI